MVLFLNPDGTTPILVPERIFRGSNEVNEIVALTPLETKTIKIGFELPNEDPVDGGLMVSAGTQDYEVGGQVLTLNVFTAKLTSNVTKYLGDVLMSFSVTLVNGTLNSFAATFTVERSAAPVMPAPPDVPTYEQILQALNDLDLNKQDKKIYRLSAPDYVPTKAQIAEIKGLADSGNTVVIGSDATDYIPSRMAADNVCYLDGSKLVTLTVNGETVTRTETELNNTYTVRVAAIEDITQAQFLAMAEYVVGGNIVYLVIETAETTTVYMSAGTDGVSLSFLRGPVFMALVWDGAKAVATYTALSTSVIITLDETVTKAVFDRMYALAQAGNPFVVQYGGGYYLPSEVGQDSVGLVNTQYEGMITVKWDASSSSVSVALHSLATLDDDGNVKQNALTATLAERATADGAGNVISDTYSVAQNEESVSAKDTYSCDYINELHREALDVDPYYVGTAGSVVTVTGTASGKYVEPEDYKVLLPEAAELPITVSIESVGANQLSVQPVINNQQTILADFGRDVTISAVLGFSVTNFTMGSAAGAVVSYRKEDGTNQYRTGGAFNWHVGETMNGVYTNKLENVTCRYIVFYGYDNGYAVLNGTIENGMMNFGAAILPYQPYESETAEAIITDPDPTNLPMLRTYAPQTTFFVSSDVAGLYPSIDLTAFAASDATLAKGLLKLRGGEVLTPLTTADMVLTADGSTVEEVLKNIAVQAGTTVTVGGVAQKTWSADTKLDATGTAARATADAEGNVISTTYATKTELPQPENWVYDTPYSGTGKALTYTVDGQYVTATTPKTIEGHTYDYVTWDLGLVTPTHRGYGTITDSRISVKGSNAPGGMFPLLPGADATLPVKCARFSVVGIDEDDTNFSLRFRVAVDSYSDYINPASEGIRITGVYIQCWYRA